MGKDRAVAEEWVEVREAAEEEWAEIDPEQDPVVTVFVRAAVQPSRIRPGSHAIRFDAQSVAHRWQGNKRLLRPY